jgi:hypothetical protein
VVRQNKRLNLCVEIFASLPVKHTTSIRDLKSLNRKSVERTTETDEAQRNKIIGEIVNTERDYCRDLDFIVEVC